MTHRIVLVRHGEAEWSRNGRHTGRTEVPLSGHGRREAEAVGRELSGRAFALVLTSPLGRARETCRLAGYDGDAQLRDDLLEWDYGAYEGLTTDEMRRDHPAWTVWDGPIPGRETVEQVAGRVDGVLGELRQAAGDVLVFSHGHLLRILAARWLGLEPG